MSTSILVIDDEKEVLRLMETILSDGGYEVVVANGAEDAARKMDAMPAPPDLVISDVVMPGMSGPMLVDRLRATRPDLRVLFMSGYDHSQVVQQYVVQQGFDLIPKPFTSRGLLAAIKKSIARV
ncbi:MAG TPA: response regulator [Bryobacteraceae bacterium]|nr:response regulator [Bryobacteraceae bacterium]